MDYLSTSLVYFITIIVSVVLTKLSLKLKSRQYNIYILAMLLPIIISGIRYNVGTDYMNYYYMANSPLPMNYLDIIHYIKRIEPGYLVLLYINNFIFEKPEGIFIITSIIIIVLYYIAIFRYREEIDLTIGILLFFIIIYFASFNGIRQYLAAGLVMISYKYLIDKNFIKYLVNIFLASLFHYTALIMLPIYFIVNGRYEKFKRKIFFFLAIPIIFLIKPLGTILTSIGPLQKYAIYLTGKGNIAILGIIFLIISAIWIMIYRKKLINYNSNNRIYIFLFFRSFILQISSGIVPYVYRLSIYFNISEIILLAQLPKAIKNKTDRKINIVGIIIYCIVRFCINYTIMNFSNIYPYQTIFNR